VKDKETNLSKTPIRKFLLQIDNLRKCEGLPDGSYHGKLYRFVSTVLRDGKPEVKTVVR
jgi:hypothetical protein